MRLLSTQRAPFTRGGINSSVPVAVAMGVLAGEPIRSIACGYTNSYVLTDDGGACQGLFLGNGGDSDQFVPVVVDGHGASFSQSGVFALHVICTTVPQ